MDAPTGILSTKYGELTYRIASGTCVGLRTDGADNEEHQALVVRGIPYRVNLSVNLNPETRTWGLKREYSSFGRRDTWEKDPSESAKGALVEAALRAFGEFIVLNPDLLKVGERRNWEEDVSRKRDEIEKSQEILEKLMQELAGILRQEPEQVSLVQ